MTYGDWMEAHAPAHPAGQCRAASAAMAAAFPELRVARGHYRPWAGPRDYPHWWCVAPDGTVVDPTAAQFDGVGPGDYVEHTGPEPTGRCPHCGEYAYGGQTFCTSTCARDWARRMNP